MKNNAEDQLIERYVRGRMDADESALFDRRLAADEQLRARVGIERLMTRAMLDDREHTAVDIPAARARALAALGTAGSSDRKGGWFGRGWKRSMAAILLAGALGTGAYLFSSSDTSIDDNAPGALEAPAPISPSMSAPIKQKTSINDALPAAPAKPAATPRPVAEEAPSAHTSRDSRGHGRESVAASDHKGRTSGNMADSAETPRESIPHVNEKTVTAPVSIE